MKKNFTAIYVAILFIACLFLGLLIGSKVDSSFNQFPLYTLIGFGTGGYSGYLLYRKFKKRSANPEKIPPIKPHETIYPVIDVSKEQVRDAIRKYSDSLPKGTYRSILVKDDHRIDFQLLAPILRGIPSKSFYMSKETYDIFDESEKDIPAIMDLVQKAVDAYSRDHRQYPMLPYDPLRRVNYYLLLNEHYLSKQPDIEFFITDYDGIITHNKPKKDQGI
jgi:hypothetical protein